MAVNYRDLLGKPFELGASGPDSYDCVGLMCEMANRLGIEYPTNFDHTRFRYECRSNEILKYFTNYTIVDTFDIGNVILFKHPSGFITHLGMVVSPTKFIHTTKKTNVIVEEISEWKSKISNIYKLK